MRKPTPRRIIDAVRQKQGTTLKLECGHHRWIGGNMVSGDWAAGPAHLAVGFTYPCVESFCGKTA